MKMLDFDDVLIVPRVSGAISSRKDVDIVREFYIRGNTLKCVPIISSNMTQTGTFKLALELLNNDYLAAIHKFYAADDIIKFIKENQLNTANLFITIGLRNKDDELKKLKQITDSVECPFSILIDVPNGYIKDFYLFVKQVRTLYPNKIIAAGNVCEREGCNRLFEAGADIIKIGIGPSCFTGGMKIQTENGLKKIKDIQVGDKVLTHTGKYQEVTHKFIFHDNKKLIKVNNIECTPNHKFYVCKVEDKDKINENNYQDYCFWLAAESLDENKHYIIEIKN